MSKAIHQDFSFCLVTYPQRCVHESSLLLSERHELLKQELASWQHLFSLFQLLPILHVIIVVLCYFHIASFCMFSYSKQLQLIFFSLSRKPIAISCPKLTCYSACLILKAADNWKRWWLSFWQEQTKLLVYFWRNVCPATQVWWHESPSWWLLMTLFTTVQTKSKLWIVTLLLRSSRDEAFTILIS